MASGEMTVTTADKHIGEVWPKAVIRAEEFSLVLAPRVYREWKFAGHGDVYHVPRIPNLEAATKTGGTDWTPTVYTDTEQTVTVNTHQVAGFDIEDTTKVLSNTNLEMEMRRKIGYSLGRALDVNIATLPQSFSQTIGTLGDELDYEDLVDAVQLLEEDGINMHDGVTWFISPAVKAGFMKMDIFINQLYQGNNGRAVQTAKIGDVQGAPVLISNLLRAPAGGQSESFVAHKNAIALIMAQEVKIVTEYRALGLSMVVGGHQIYGYAEVNRYSEAPGNITATDNYAVLLNTVGAA